MVELRKQNEQTRDYRERFEFRLTVGSNIICQRYFKINNFNTRSLKSYELTDTIRHCVAVIDEELRSKTQTYLEITAPSVFKSVEEMNKFFQDESNRRRMRPGIGISVKDSKVDYVWGSNNAPVACNFKFEEDYSSPLTDEDTVEYKFSFLIDGNEVCSMIWDGTYPKYIRNSIDLSNKKGKQEKEDLDRLSFEQYLDYKLVEGRSDLVWSIIKDICHTCSVPDNSWYTVSDKIGDKVYKNLQDYSIWIDRNGDKVKSVSSK